MSRSSLIRTASLTLLLLVMAPAARADAQLLPRTDYEDIQLNGEVPLSVLSDRVEVAEPLALAAHLIAFLGDPESAACEENPSLPGEWVCEFEWPGIYARYLRFGAPFFHVQTVLIEDGFLELDGDTIQIGDTVDGVAAMFPDAWEARQERCGRFDYDPCAWYVRMSVEPERPEFGFRYEAWWVTAFYISDPWPV